MMDTRDGTIYSSSETIRRMVASGEMAEADLDYMRPMAVPPTPAQKARASVGRNDPCPCGSGTKFKRCCLLRRGAMVR